MTDTPPPFGEILPRPNCGGTEVKRIKTVGERVVTDDSGYVLSVHDYGTADYQEVMCFGCYETIWSAEEDSDE